MTGIKGALGALAGDLSFTILVERICSFFNVASFETPKTKGIGQWFPVDLMALPKSNDAVELNEKSEEESPSSLRSFVVDLGEIEGLCREGSSG
jgi:hypothetical protein